jgi:Protein of unknown function (DUF2510)
MTAPDLNETATVRDLLFGEGPGTPTDALAESLRGHGTIRALPALPGLSTAVEREVASATDGLLGLNLAELAASGWKKYDALRQAARRTRDAPTAEEIVALATHTIESSHHPAVELFIDGKSMGTIEIELQIAFTMAGVLAVVRQARLTSIRSGTCTVTGSLAMQQIVITKRQRRFDLPGAIRLRHGLPLLEPAASPAPVAQAVVMDAKSPGKPGAWYCDPTQRYEFRWWDGSRWTQRVATQGRTMSDPVDCATVSEEDRDDHRPLRYRTNGHVQDAVPEVSG